MTESDDKAMREAFELAVMRMEPGTRYCLKQHPHASTWYALESTDHAFEGFKLGLNAARAATRFANTRQQKQPPSLTEDEIAEIGAEALEANLPGITKHHSRNSLRFAAKSVWWAVQNAMQRKRG